MQVTVDQNKVFAMLDVLVERWKTKRYPYNRPDAVIPQTIIPADLYADQYTLACWYFYTCIYMRGGIESLQAFNALIRMWRQLPDFFDPGHAALMQPADIQPVLRKFIGWDSKAASINWVYNSRRLMQDWQGNPLSLIKGLRDYDEALRRMRNKLTKRDLRKAGIDGAGFRGFQPKMVSMLLYFYDWEGQSVRGRNQRWLKPRFHYPSPADFHNFRLALATIAMSVERNAADDVWTEIYGGQIVRTGEKISAPWRKTVMAYLKDRRADPLEVADAIWLFSLMMCGNSPVTVTREESPTTETSGLFSGTATNWDHGQWVLSRKTTALAQTCYVCPFLRDCRYAIPAKPYYRKGGLILRPHPLNNAEVPRNLPDPLPRDVVVDPEVQHILDLKHPVPAK